MEEIFKRNSNINYSLHDFDENPGEKEAIRIAKRKALQALYSVDDITEIGSGSEGRTTVYKVDQDAVKVICCQTERYSGEKLKEEEKSFLHNVKENLSSRPTLINEIQCWITVTKSANNIIPMYGFKLFSWVCPEYNRVGVDCAVEMALAECMADLKEKPTSQDDILQAGIDLSTALITLHRNNLIHRDIKPANIFLYDEKFCLGDFGIAIDRNNPQYLQGGHHREEDAKGTHAYAAPEQEKGEQVDYRADIYSLGLVLYELSDTAPMSSHYCDRIHKYQLPELASKNVSEGLKIILRNACEYQKEYRYQTAEEFREDLCRLKNNPDYIPKSTRTKFEQKNKTPNTFHRLGTESSSNALPPNSRFRKFGVNSQQNLEKYLTPETAWNAGKFWYEESCKSGSRFNGLDIDKKIMPLTSPETHITDLPVNVTMDPEDSSAPVPLAEILEHTEKLHNMYLIGEGGIGKTTALRSIMKDTYNNKNFIPAASDKPLVIPLFIELSKAPSSYCGAYKHKQSTFIQRYLFMLIGSLSENHLIFENSYEMTAGMEKEADSIIKNIRFLLNNVDSNVKYLLLLDGLNEVSRKRLVDNENNYIGTPSELIIDEIQELLRYQNVSVIITSRADETLGALDDEFNHLYLTGVDKQDVEEYLSKHEISYTAIEDNKRLMETLKIPLFLKLYSQLYSVSGVSTPGEILYAFFSERSMQYSARGRITEIEKERRISGNTHSDNLINEKMQWFILDFLLPELGWYMEKNELYTSDLTTIEHVLGTVLKETGENNICGKYGIAMFSDYHNGKDGSINVKTYADQLLALESVNRSYVQEIIDYCVCSLGILYVNNQEYGFIHQHFRDFFAAMKIITDMKMALYIAKISAQPEIALQCLEDIGDILLSDKVSLFIGEILGEYRNIPENRESCWIDVAPVDGKRGLITNVISLYRNHFPEKREKVRYNIVNLLRIIELSRHTFNGFNFSYLDLRNCHFNTKDLKNADMTGCFLEHPNFFSGNNCGEICKTVFSKSGEYVYIAGRDRTLSLWHRKTQSYIKTIKRYTANIYNLSTSEKYIAVATYTGTEILDINTFEVVKTFKSYNAVFSPDGKYIVLAFYKKKAQLCDTFHFECIYELDYALRPYMADYIRGIDLICFSPDSKHLAIATQKKHIFNRSYGDYTPFMIQIWDIEKKNFFQIEKADKLEKIINIDFSDTGRLLLVTKLSCSILEIYAISDGWDSAALLHSIDIKEKMSSPSTNAIAKFVQNDKTIAISLSSGELFFLDYDKYDKEHILYVLKKKKHELSISSMTKFKNSKGSFILAGSNDHTATLWNIEQSQYIGTFNNMNFRRVTSALFVNDGKYIVTSGQNNSVLIWSLKSKKCIDVIENLPQCTGRMAYHNEKQLLAIAIMDGRVSIYHFDTNIQSFSYLYTLKMQDWEISKLEYSITGEYLLATGFDASYITIYNFNNNKQTIINQSEQIRSASFYDVNGESVLIGYRNRSGDSKLALKIFSSNTGEFIKEIYSYKPPYYESKLLNALHDTHYEMHWANAISIDSASNLMYILKNGPYIEIQDLTTNQCLAILNPKQRSGIYTGNNFAISKKGSYITNSSRTPNITIYQKNNWKAAYNIFGLWESPSSGFISDIINAIHYFRYKEYNGHQQEITSVDFSPNEKILLTASADGTIKLWTLPPNNTNEPLTLSASSTMKCITGIKTQGLVIKNLHKGSDLSNEDKMILEQYGAII